MAEEKVIESLVIELVTRLEPLKKGLEEAQATMATWSKDAKTKLKAFEDSAREAAVAAAALVAPLALGVKAFADLQVVLNSIESKSGATAEEMRKIRDTAIQMGADTQFSAMEAAQGFEELTKAGFTVQQQLDAMPGVLNLAAAGEMGVGQAAEITAGILRGFGLAMSEAGRVADELAQAANTSAVDVTDMAEAMKYIAPVAAASNQSLSEMDGILAALGNQMIKGSQAGTSMRAMLVALQNPSGDARKVLSGLGISIQDVKGRMLPLSDIINQLRDRTAKYTETQRSAAIAQVFGQESLSAVLALLNQAPGKLEEYIQAQERSTGASQRMADGLNRGLNFEMKQLGGSLETVAGKFGSDLEPAISKVVHALTSLVNLVGSIPAPVRTVISVVTLFAAGVLSLIAAIGGIVAVLPAVTAGFAAFNLTLGAGLALITPWAVAAAAIATALGFVAVKVGEVAQEQDAANQSIQASNEKTAQLAGKAVELQNKMATGYRATAKEAKEAALGFALLAARQTDPELREAALQQRRNMMAYAETVERVEKAEKARGAAVKQSAEDQKRAAKELADRQKQDAAELLQLDLARIEAAGTGYAGQIKAYTDYAARLRKVAGAAREVLQVEAKITQLRAQQSKAETDKAVKAANFETQKALILNEKFKGGLAGQLRIQEAYLESLRKIPNTLDEQRRVQLDILRLQVQQAEAAKQLAKQQADALVDLVRGLGDALNTETLDELRAKAAAIQADIDKMRATGGDPAEIVKQERELSNTNRDISKAERAQAGAVPGFVAGNFDKIIQLPAMLDGTAKVAAELGVAMAKASEGVMSFLSGAWTSLTNIVETVATYGMPALQFLLTEVMGALGAGMGALGAAIAPLLPIIALVVLAFALLQQMWQSNAGGIQEALTNIMNALGALWGAIMHALAPLAEVLGGILAFIGNAIAASIGIVVGLVEGFAQLVGWIGNLIMSFGPLRWIIDGIVWIFGQLWGALATFIEFVTFGKVKLKAKGDNAKEAAAAQTKQIEEDRSFNAQIGSFKIDTKDATKEGMKEALASFTSFNPLPVEDVSKAGAFFGSGPQGRFFVQQETTATLRLEITGDQVPDKAAMIKLANDPDVRAAWGTAQKQEMQIRDLVPRFS